MSQEKHYGQLENELNANGIDVDGYNSRKQCPFPLYALLRDYIESSGNRADRLLEYAIESYSFGPVAHAFKTKMAIIKNYEPKKARIREAA